MLTFKDYTDTMEYRDTPAGRMRVLAEIYRGGKLYTSSGYMSLGTRKEAQDACRRLRKSGFDTQASFGKRRSWKYVEEGCRLRRVCTVEYLVSVVHYGDVR